MHNNDAPELDAEVIAALLHFAPNRSQWCYQKCAGQFNDILIVDDFVVRISNGLTPPCELKTQVDLLKILNKCISFPIPVLLRASDQTSRLKWMIYRKLDGVPLSLIKLERYARHTVARLFGDLGSFLHGLHSVRPDLLEGVTNKGVSGELEIWTKLISDFEAELMHTRSVAVNAARHQLASFVATSTKEMEMRLIHGDFGPTNILVDDELNLTGVIDFDFARIGDPASDLASISCAGEQYLSFIYETYPELEKMWQRASFYKSTFALQDALYEQRLNESISV